MSDQEKKETAPKEKEIYLASKKLAIRSLESARSGIDALRILEKHGFDITGEDVQEITSRIDQMLEKIKKR